MDLLKHRVTYFVAELFAAITMVHLELDLFYYTFIRLIRAFILSLISDVDL